MSIKTIRVIPHTVQVAPDGSVASIYGAHVPGSKQEQRGYTWETVERDGSVRVGLGRKPVKTFEEAVGVAKEVAVKLGYVYKKN